MEFRNYSFTGAKQNFQIPYLPDRRMPNLDSCHVYNLSGQHQNTEKSPISKVNNFLHSFANFGQRSAMPISFACSLPYDSKKKFVNHKKSFSTLRENNFIKDPSETKAMNTDGGYYYSSKGTGSVCSTISSHIVGGFVGSKSQVNNGKTKACDLGSFIFDVLNNMKWGRSEDRSTVTKGKNMDCNQQAAPQQLRHISQGSSHNMEEVKKLDNNFNFGNVISLSNKDNEDKKWSCSKKLNGINGINGIVKFNIPTDPSTVISCENRSMMDRNTTKPIQDCSKTTTKLMENIKPLCIKSTANSKTVPNVDFSASDSNSTKIAESPLSLSPKYFTIPIENSKKIKKEEPQSPGILEGCLKNKICSAIGSRLRQFSECSVESTDSESFIVFDDRYCDLMEDEDDDDLEDIDEDEENTLDDNYGCCSIAEANAKWKAWYSDEDANFNSDCENSKVKFNDKIDVHLMVKWDYAYRAARLGPWEQMARDRCRFRDRILRLETTLSPVLRKDHREKIYKSLYS